MKITPETTNHMENDVTGKCRICRNHTHSKLGDASHSYHVCEHCSDKHLGDSAEPKDRLAKLDKAVAIATIEKIPLIYALNILNGVYDPVEAKRRMTPPKASASSHKPAKKQPVMKRSGNCLICMRLTRDAVSNSSFSTHLCADCDKRFFNGYRNPEVKADILQSAFRLARQEKIGLMYALNIELGFYDIEEARRRISARSQDRGRFTTDIFVVGKRLPGSYR